VIDLHTHILPGVDDGPPTMAGSIEMARSMVADGVRVAAATPHVRRDFPTTPERMEHGLRELDEALVAAGVPLQVVAGGELAIDVLPSLTDEALRRFSLGGHSRYVLVETPYTAWPVELHECLYDLRRKGFVPVLAHPERNPEVQRVPELLAPFVAGGVLVQLTAASLDGRLGGAPRTAAVTLLRRGLAHLLASDAHAPSIRAAGLSEARDVIQDPGLRDLLTVSTPHAILSDEQVSPTT
jgi:protein-tyrosine phosphatase